MTERRCGRTHVREGGIITFDCNFIITDDPNASQRVCHTCGELARLCLEEPKRFCWVNPVFGPLCTQCPAKLEGDRAPSEKEQHPKALREMGI